MNTNIDDFGNIRRRIRSNRIVVEVLTDEELGEKLSQLLADTETIRKQIKDAYEERKNHRFPINEEWLEKAELALKYKFKTIMQIRKEAKNRRESLKDIHIEKERLLIESKNRRHEMNMLKDVFEDSMFVKVCSEIMDREQYISIWEKVNERIAQSKGNYEKVDP